MSADGISDLIKPEIFLVIFLVQQPQQNGVAPGG